MFKLADKIANGILKFIYDQDIEDDFSELTLMRRPPRYDTVENVLIIEMDKKGRLVDKSFEQGNINAVFRAYLSKVMNAFVFNEILNSSVEAFRSERYTDEQLKAYGMKVVDFFRRTNLITKYRRVAFVVVNNKKRMLVDNVDSDIIEPARLNRYVKAYPYSKIRVVFFGSYKPDKYFFPDVKQKYGYEFHSGWMVATVDENFNTIFLGGDKSKSYIEFGLITFDELYSIVGKREIKSLLLSVYDTLSKSAKRMIDSMSRGKKDFFNNLIIYLANVKLYANGVYYIRYAYEPPDKSKKREGIVFFVQIGNAVRRENPNVVY